MLLAKKARKTFAFMNERERKEFVELAQTMLGRCCGRRE